jgi:hypothetical protein
MSTYKKIEQPKEQWVVINGVVGTAHMNRAGDWVNFRPARRRDEHIAGKWNDRRVASVTWWAARGGQGASDTVTVHYTRRVAVDYRTCMVTVAGPESNPFAVGEPEPGFTGKHASNPLYMDAFDGFPIPPEILAEREAVKAKYAATATRLEDTKAKANAAVAAWAEGLTGNERRWMSRWLNFGKAEEQVIAAAEKALAGHMRGYVIDGLEEFRRNWRKEVNGK